MQLTNKGKIALGLAVVLIFTVVWMYFNSKKQKDATETTENSVTTEPYALDTTKYPESPVAMKSGDTTLPIEDLADQTTSGSPTASATTSVRPDASATASTRVARTPVSTVDANGVRSYKIAVTPAPNAGPLDWTVTEKEITIHDFTNSDYANKSFCGLAGLNNSWSNSVEKISCDVLNFLDERIGEQFASLACAFYASGIQASYKDSLSYQYQDGACLLIDR